MEKYKRYLQLSSISLFVPIMWAKKRVHKINYALLGGVSLMYWYKPIKGWRRNIDMCLAKCTFMYNVKTLIIDQKSPSVCGVILTPLIPVCYLCSIYNYNKKTDWWVVYHMNIHLITSTALVLLNGASFPKK